MELQAAAPSMALMFVLGLRHGLAPDHIAFIDGMAMQGVQERARSARWVGALFALGHGLAITFMAVLLGALGVALVLPVPVARLLEWMPVLLLIVLGTINLCQLLRQASFSPVAWKDRILPGRLRHSSHPVAIFSVGVIFALVFESVAQAATWGYAASAHGGAMAALMAGLAFTAGMLITDTADGLLMVRIFSRSAGQGRDYRRVVGWCMVVLSYGVALYTIAGMAAGTSQ